MNNIKTYISKEKYEEVKSELEYLKKTKRSEIAKKLEEAKSFGDLSENAEYHLARQEQGEIEDRIRQLEGIIKTAELVFSHKGNVVEIGTKVVIKLKGSDKKQEFEIVGSEESDTKSGKLSFDSPLGSAMIGKKKGENFKFSSPSGKIFEYSILDIK